MHRNKVILHRVKAQEVTMQATEGYQCSDADPKGTRDGMRGRTEGGKDE